MKTQAFHFEILAVLFLSVIPWPGPSVFKISCPRERASAVRRIVHKRWIPILKKYQVELPLECPFHESRDIFRPQQKAKYQHRPSQWTCGFCGKSFYTERHLDAHFDNRHKSNINMAEDAVCLADYCDIMRCDVLNNRDFENSVDEDGSHLNTDIQIWRENIEQRTTAIPCKSRSLTRIYPIDRSCAIARDNAMRNLQRYCRRDDTADLRNHRLTRSSYQNGLTGPDNKSSACDSEDDEDEDDEDEEDEENLVETALPAIDKKQRRKSLHPRKLKSNCKPEELQKLKIQCEILVRDCIAGLLTNLSVRDFQEVEGELNRAICWYLSCDRYWEDTKRHRHTSWCLLTVFIVLLSSSLYGCYYVIWILFNTTDDDKLNNTENMRYNGSMSTSPLHTQGSYGEGRLEKRKGTHGDENLPISSENMPDHYIYVSYPPELKRRLLESCYNRTTRL